MLVLREYLIRAVKEKRGGGFNIKDLNPVRLAKKTTKTVKKKAVGVAKKKITQVAKKIIGKQVRKHGLKIGMSKKAADKLTDATVYALGKQLDKRM